MRQAATDGGGEDGKGKEEVESALTCSPTLYFKLKKAIRGKIDTLIIGARLTTSTIVATLETIMCHVSSFDGKRNSVSNVE